ncbi:MAG: PfkB family carbohydrate kinase [Bryobacteraceae bacterium]|nr:PfkB family carbohydrate kinase [Bryobacteraceae bacterium]MCX7602650.1 PfkB family carbohydrate kinase [Bryobacteraceae bacterium]
MSLVVVGSVAYDGVQTPAGRVDRMLGGACTYISLAASYFTPVSIVAVVGEDFAEEDAELLASRGIDLEGLQRAPGRTFFWAGVYSDDMNDRETLVTELNVFADFQPVLPASYRGKQYLMLGNIQPALQRSVRAQMDGVRLAGGDTMNFWIEGQRDELLETIRGWDFLLINDSEARLLSGERNLKRAAAAIRALGPRILVIKRGEYGATLFHDEGAFSLPGYLLDTLRDPTGAGDCFAGGFIGSLAERGVTAETATPADLARAVVYGSVMGSFCCEEFGVNRFRTLTRDDIERRFQEFRQLTAF